MNDDAPPADEAPGNDAIQRYLASFRDDLRTRTDAIDAAFHFDDRGAVNPAYERLMRIAEDHRELLGALARPRPASDPARGDALDAVDATMAVLRGMSAGVERYHGLSGELSRSQSRLAVAIGRLAG